MELDDFKTINQPGKGPYNKDEKNKKNPMDTFIEELKMVDAKDRKTTRLFIIIMGMFVVIYSGKLVFYHGMLSDGFAILVLGFLLILLYMFFRYRRLKRIDYAVPSIEFLKEATRRYRFMTVIDWIIIIPLLILLITGGAFIVYSSFLKYTGSSPWPLAVYFLIMAAAVCVGFWVGIKNWKRDKSTIREKIRKMQQELTG